MDFPLKDVYKDMCWATTTDVTGDCFIDSAASFHCNPNRKFVHDYVFWDFENVILGNGKRCKIIRKGSILFKLPNGCQLKLRDARHIHQVKKNLITACMLDREGFVVFANAKWKITKDNKCKSTALRIHLWNIEILHAAKQESHQRSNLP